MKKIGAGQTIQILANIGVIAGIVFLGIELSQNNRLMEEEARRSRAFSVEETWSTLAENDELARLFVKDRNGDRLDEVESLRVMAYWLRSLTDLELAFLELPEEELAPTVARYRQNFRLFPSLASTWDQQRFGFREDFVRWLEENVVDTE